MRKIVWLSSICDRGNFVMEYGKVYDIDKAEKIVSDITFESWLYDGSAMKLEDWNKLQKKQKKEAEAKTKKVEDPAVEAEEEDIIEEGDLRKMKKLTTEPEEETEDIKIPEEKLVASIPMDSDGFECTKEDCYKHGDPYKQYWNFQSHMKKRHGENWVQEGDNLILKED